MTKDEAKELQDALQTQSRCSNRLMYPEREPGPLDDQGKPTWVITKNYNEADLWITAQKVIDLLVNPILLQDPPDPTDPGIST